MIKAFEPSDLIFESRSTKQTKQTCPVRCLWVCYLIGTR